MCSQTKRDPKKSFEIMGAVVKQTGEQFEKSQSYLRWQDREANKKFFAGEHQAFSKEAAGLLLELGIIKNAPDTASIVDTQFIIVSDYLFKVVNQRLFPWSLT